MKKYKVIFGNGEFECTGYVIHPTCVEFLKCGNEDYYKIIPTNVVFSIYPLKNKL